MDLVEYEWFRKVSVAIMAEIPEEYLLIMNESWFQQLFFDDE